jgi:hypothetical protein
MTSKLWVKRLTLATWACACWATAPAPAWAQSAVDEFSRCMAENSTGKDRKVLARWLFVSMGAHPEMRSVSTLSAGAAEQASREAGELFTRLLADQCPNQTRAAVRAVGPVAIQSAFAVLGQLAMQELMTDKDVAAGMALLQKHLNTSKLEPLLNPR